LNCLHHNICLWVQSITCKRDRACFSYNHISTPLSSLATSSATTKAPSVFSITQSASGGCEHWIRLTGFLA
jgi:hypothetical protein